MDNQNHISLFIGKAGRSDEEMNLDGQPGAKRRKLDGEGELAGRTFSFTYIPTDCVRYILQFFSVKDLLVFEHIEKGMSRGITSCQWKEICEHKGYNCTWSDLTEYPESSQDKMRYLGNVVLLKLQRTYLCSKTQFVVDTRSLSKENRIEKIKTRYFSFHARLTRFPALQAYIYQDLKYEAKYLFCCRSEIESSIGDNKPLKNNDILLKGLVLFWLSKRMIELSDVLDNEHQEIADRYKAEGLKAIDAAEKCLTQAVKEGMKGASVLASTLTTADARSRWHSEPYDVALRLAKLSITQNCAQDYRGLHELLKHMSAKFFHEISDYAPTLEYEAIQCYIQRRQSDEENYDKWGQADVLFKKAIKAYGEKILPQTWENLCFFKIEWAWNEADLSNLGGDKQLEEARLYKNRAIAAWEEDKEACYLFLKRIADHVLDSRSFLNGELEEQEFVDECVRELISFCPNKMQLRQEWKNRCIKEEDLDAKFSIVTYFLFNTYDEEEKVSVSLELLHVWLQYRIQGCEFNLDLSFLENMHENEMDETTFEGALVKGVISYHSGKNEQARFLLNRAKEMMVGENFFDGLCSRKEIEEAIENIEKRIDNKECKFY